MSSTQLAEKFERVNDSKALSISLKRSFHVSLANFLLDHASRILVLAQADKLRMSQPISLGPFEEFNLSDDLWHQPNCFLHLLSVQLFTKSRSSCVRQICERARR